MKVAIQAPIPLLQEYCTLTNYQVCKAYLIAESTLYANFYLTRKSLGDYIVLDCAVGDPRSSVPTNILLESAKFLKPHLVVAPDREMSLLKTVELTLEFLDSYNKELKPIGIGLLGMVQGANLEQCLYCYRSLVRLVDSIGLPRSLEAAVGRSNFLRRIKTRKPIHLFGVHSNPEEELGTLLNLERDNVVGISTDLPIRLGLKCRLIDEYRPEPPPLDYYSNHNPFPDFTLKNIEDFLDLAEE